MKKYTVKHIQVHTTQYTFIIFLIYMFLFKNKMLSTLMENMSTWSHDIFAGEKTFHLLLIYVDGTDRCFRESLPL